MHSQLHIRCHARRRQPLDVHCLTTLELWRILVQVPSLKAGAGGKTTLAAARKLARGLQHEAQRSRISNPAAAAAALLPGQQSLGAGWQQQQQQCAEDGAYAESGDEGEGFQGRRRQQGYSAAAAAAAAGGGGGRMQGDLEVLATLQLQQQQQQQADRWRIEHGVAGMPLRKILMIATCCGFL